jgi:peptidoglycan/LPS O-acetylase OafA/YrhL
MQRLPGLDLLRALAISWVIFFHAGTLGLGWAGGDFSGFGWMGVDLFFVLSGFLIGTQWLEALRTGQQSPFRTFYQRRAYRILPAYLLIVASYFAFPALREKPAIQPLWQFLTFTENLLIDFSSGKAFSHVWSLCVEEHFYLLFPLLSVALLQRPSARKTVVTLLGLVLAGMAWRAHVWLDDVSLRPESTQIQGYYERLYYPTWTRLDGLVMGVLLAVVRVHRPALWARALEHRAWVLLTGALTFAASVWLFEDRESTAATVFGYPLLSLGLAFVVLGCAAPGQRAVPGAAFIATVSYSLYLSHKQALHLMKSWQGETLGAHPWLAVAAYGTATLLYGLLLHFAVERPFLALRARR